MEIIYARQPFPPAWEAALFLAGPTPRAQDVSSWRPEALRLLKACGYRGVVFVPEAPNGEYQSSYIQQVEWERQAMSFADCILFWVPRDLQRLPGFTTNVEFGIWSRSAKAVLGFPPDAEKCRYLRWLAEAERIPMRSSLSDTVEVCVTRLSRGGLRKDGERAVPLFLWRTESFQHWYRALRAAGNRLESANLLWSFTPARASKPFAWILWVKVWVAAEERFKANEFVLSRSDIAVTLLHGPLQSDLLDTEVVLVREFRSPGRTSDGFVHGLPGGSSPREHVLPVETAVDEVTEETGMRIAPTRWVPVGVRQLDGTLSTHVAHAFRVELTAEEMEQARGLAALGTRRGVETERAYLQIRRMRDLLKDLRVDWAMLGMALGSLLDVAEMQRIDGEVHARFRL